MLKHDDKRSKSEANDSKATPFDEVEPGASEESEAPAARMVETGSTTIFGQGSAGASIVKLEPKSPSTASCLALALAGGSRQHETLRTTSPR